MGSAFDLHGKYCDTITAQTAMRDIPSASDNDVPTGNDVLDVHLSNLRKHDPDYETLRPYFLGCPAAIIKCTYENFTQYYRTGVDSTGMKQTFCLPFPALNVHHRNEPVATDTLYADVPAIGTGGQC